MTESFRSVRSPETMGRALAEARDHHLARLQLSRVGDHTAARAVLERPEVPVAARLLGYPLQGGTLVRWTVVGIGRDFFRVGEGVLVRARPARDALLPGEPEALRGADRVDPSRESMT